jgi:hypothetical protein
MDHRAIEENQVPDRYLLGSLSAADRAEFEEHYLDCPACLEHLEAAEGLRAGLKELSSGAVVPILRAPRAAVLLRPVVLLAAACLALAALVPALFLGRYRRTAGELAASRTAVEEARKETASLTDALARALKAKTDATSPAVSVFTLDRTRAAGPNAPIDRIRLRDASSWTVLLLDRPDAPRGARLSARLATPDGGEVGTGFPASEASGDRLAVALPPGLLAENAYVLTLEAAGSDSAPARELATYRFRAVRTR